MLNPAVCRTHGRPRGASNLPTASQALSTETGESTQAEPDRSTQREPSQHEYVLADENLNLRCEYGRGRGRGRGVQGGEGEP